MVFQPSTTLKDDDDEVMALYSSWYQRHRTNFENPNIQFFSIQPLPRVESKQCVCDVGFADNLVLIR
jgi:hypothetical protein